MKVAGCCYVCGRSLEAISLNGPAFAVRVIGGNKVHLHKGCTKSFDRDEFSHPLTARTPVHTPFVLAEEAIYPRSQFE